MSITATGLTPQTGDDYRVDAANRCGQQRRHRPVVDRHGSHHRGNPTSTVVWSDKLRFKFASNVSGQQFVLVDGGSVDGIFTVQNAAIDGTTIHEHVSGVVLRRVDSANYIDLMYQVSTSDFRYRVRRIVGGTVTLDVQHADTDLIKVTDQAGTITSR